MMNLRTAALVLVASNAHALTLCTTPDGRTYAGDQPPPGCQVKSEFGPKTEKSEPRASRKPVVEAPPLRPGEPPRGIRLSNGWLLEWGSSQKVLEENGPTEEGYSGPRSTITCDALPNTCLARSVPEPYTGGYFEFVDGKFYRGFLRFHVNRFPEVEQSLTASLGKPSKREVGSVQNRMGASFDQVELGWVTGDVVTTASMRASNIDEGELSMTYSPLAKMVPEPTPKPAPF